ncbi:WcbI family polysaccharide biosynthesis putative acetyltransferase [Ramlibacter sp.]|uniref:WcbI family polysaccharide biosynthesis putative acetyltransferase n=1 Tax=Ramlibacter sp. TaxID=1917967 RepID=UPI002FC98E82
MTATLPSATGPWCWGGRGAAPRTVIVYGNCQVPYLARMLAAIDDLNDDYRFVFAANHVLPGEAAPRPVPEALSRDAALLLHQYEEHEQPAARALRAQLPAGCPVLRFPSYLLTGLWPFECPDPRGVPDAAFPYTRYPLGDMIALEIARHGLRGALAVGAYLDLSARKMPNLQVRLQRDLERMRRYDTQVDVPLFDHVEANFRREHLFWTNGHVSRPAVAELARRVMEAARPVLGGSADRTAACLAAVDDFEGMGSHQHPVHPMAAEAYGLEWWAPDRTWQWYDQQWTYFEYIERYIGYEPW